MHARVCIGDVQRQPAIVEEQMPAARGHLLVNGCQGIPAEADWHALDQRDAHADRGVELPDQRFWRFTRGRASQLHDPDEAVDRFASLSRCGR